MKTKVVYVIRKSDRFIAVKLVLKRGVLAIIASMYAPQKWCAEDEKNSF